jgi:hypothetical protein
MQWTLNASQPTIINWFANSGPLKNEDWLLEATTSAPLAENPTINTHLKFCFRLTEPGYDKLELASLLRGLTGGVLAIADRVTKGAFDRALESSRS